MAPSSFRVPSPRAAVYDTGCALHNSWGSSCTGCLVGGTPGIVQCCSPTDSSKASFLMGKTLRLEVKVFKIPRPRKLGDQA